LHPLDFLAQIERTRAERRGGAQALFEGARAHNGFERGSVGLDRCRF